MSRILIPSRDKAPEGSKVVLDAVHKQLGVVPTCFVSSVIVPPLSLPSLASKAR